MSIMSVKQACFFVCPSICLLSLPLSLSPSLFLHSLVSPLVCLLLIMRVQMYVSMSMMCSDSFEYCSGIIGEGRCFQETPESI